MRPRFSTGPLPPPCSTARSRMCSPRAILAGFIVAPNDSVRIAGAFEQVIAAGVLPTMIDTSVLDANPDLKGDWAQ